MYSYEEMVPQKAQFNDLKKVLWWTDDARAGLDWLSVQSVDSTYWTESQSRAGHSQSWCTRTETWCYIRGHEREGKCCKCHDTELSTNKSSYMPLGMRFRIYLQCDIMFLSNSSYSFSSQNIFQVKIKICLSAPFFPGLFLYDYIESPNPKNPYGPHTTGPKPH